MVLKFEYRIKIGVESATFYICFIRIDLSNKMNHVLKFSLDLIKMIVSPSNQQSADMFIGSLF